jgi:chromosome segregation ATPase
MKNFHQNLLITLALGLCGLCAWQWYGQTLQRNQIESLNQMVYQKAVAIEGYTNSIKTMEHEISQMDAQITELKATVKTNNETILLQKRELNKLEAQTEALTNEITQYKAAVATIETRLKDAYDGMKKQNEAMQRLVTERDEYVTKYNDSIRERNEIVAKYNDLVAQVEKLQGGGGKSGGK